MKQAFKKYASTLLGIKAPRVRRIEEIIAFYEGLLTAKVEAVFLSETTKEDGTRDYEGLWLLCGGYLCEAKSPFGNSADYDGTFLDLSKYYWKITMEKYDFGLTATPESRLSFEATMPLEISCELNAYGPNCVALRSFVQQCFVAARMGQDVGAVDDDATIALAKPRKTRPKV